MAMRVMSVCALWQGALRPSVSVEPSYSLTLHSPTRFQCNMNATGDQNTDAMQRTVQKSQLPRSGQEIGLHPCQTFAYRWLAYRGKSCGAGRPGW